MILQSNNSKLNTISDIYLSNKPFLRFFTQSR